MPRKKKHEDVDDVVEPEEDDDRKNDNYEVSPAEIIEHLGNGLTSFREGRGDVDSAIEVIDDFVELSINDEDLDDVGDPLSCARIAGELSSAVTTIQAAIDTMEESMDLLREIFGMKKAKKKSRR